MRIEDPVARYLARLAADHAVATADLRAARTRCAADPDERYAWRPPACGCWPVRYVRVMVAESALDETWRRLCRAEAYLRSLGVVTSIGQGALDIEHERRIVRDLDRGGPARRAA